ncbi:hypothetical protein [Nonomuraea diastatica]|uniref:hypothetical protein n=1 Tax=Nonomuraea diastatica TaxID=1848329 RepID=UPI001FE64019|nr:hypothetical protein [Nonomuraea diastatica]
MVAGFSLAAQLAMLLAATAPLARRRRFAKLQAKELYVPGELLPDYLSDSARMSRETLLAGVGEKIRFTLPAGWADVKNPALVRQRRALSRRKEAGLPSCSQLPGETE